MTNTQSTPFLDELREAFHGPGCAFCRLLDKHADKFVDSILWEMVNDPGTRIELNQARGYCNQHAWLLVRGGAALGTAILMNDVVKTLLKVADERQLEGKSRRSLQRLLERNHQAATRLAAELSPQTPCPVCANSSALEKYYATTLLAHMDGRDSLAEAYQASDGLCLPHFRYTLIAASPANDLAPLVEAQIVVWQRLHGELEEFIRKSDFRFRDETSGVEKDSWRRALEAVSGAAPQVSRGKGLTQT